VRLRLGRTTRSDASDKLTSAGDDSLAQVDQPRAGPISRFLARPVPDDIPHRIVWHPFALAAGFVLLVFAEVAVTPYAMFRSLLIALAAAGVLTAIASALARNVHKGGLVASFVLFALVGWESPFLVLAALVLILILAWLAGRITNGRVPWPRATFVLNVVSTIFVVAVLLRLPTTPGAVDQVLHDLHQGAGSIASDGGQGRVSDVPPDIVLILLDGYPRADELARLFGFDNEPFLQSLEQRGFDVSQHSHSNYSLTELTLASMLNMSLLDEIDELQPAIRGEADPQPVLRNVTNAAAGLNFLNDQGYETIATAPGYEEVALRQSDVFLDTGQINEFEVVLLRETGLSAVVPAIAPDFMADQHRARVEANIDSIRQLVPATAPTPRFVLIHIPIPHAPIVYGASGEHLRMSITLPYDYNSDGQSPELQRVQYAAQLGYLNSLVLDALDDALARLDDNSVIILWSDHGSRIDLDTDQQLSRQEYVSNFFAARTPGHPDLFGDSPTLVNTLPTLFDTYLGASIPRSPERFFVSHQAAPFQWIEVAVDDRTDAAVR
jgi:hypothetical protein